MNNGPLVFFGLLAALATSFWGLLIASNSQIGSQQPVVIEATGEQYPPARPGLAQEGAQVYVAQGCAECHSQQVRGLGADRQRLGWGKRISVAQDYLRDGRVQLGSQRIGPDLANFGARQTNAAIVLAHLYDPQKAMPGSMMPPYRFLFKARALSAGEALPPNALVPSPKAGFAVVPSDSANALAAYLISLKSDVPLFEAPVPPPPTNSSAATSSEAVTTNAPAPREMSKKHKPSGQSESATSFEKKGGGYTRAPVIMEMGGEPTANRATFPVLFIAILVAILFWGDMYLLNHGGELDARVYTPYESVAQLKSYQPKGEGDLLRAKGQRIYNLYCVACHQADGNGNPSAFIPPLAGSDWVSPKDPSRIIRIVLHGLQGPITVSGKQFGQAAMLPWRDALTDEDVAAVLTYVRSAWGNKAEAVSANLAKEIRAATKERMSNFTSDELLQLPLRE